MGLDLGCRLGRRLDNRDDPKGVLTVVDVDGVKVKVEQGQFSPPSSLVTFRS